jgi:hypothetical protein
MQDMTNTAFVLMWWQRLGRAARGLLFPRYWLAVVELQPLRLVLNSDGREVVVDGRARTIAVPAEEKVLAGFEAVQSIDLAHHPRDDAQHKPEHWSVTLYLGRSQRAYVGRSRKRKQASEAAALLARITGKTVRELEVLNTDSHIPSR